MFEKIQDVSNFKKMAAYSICPQKLCPDCKNMNKINLSCKEKQHKDLSNITYCMFFKQIN
ncbi:MAG: hypothetical protein ACYDDE_00735 [bacterium]